MLLVETEPIKASVRLILREPTVSNFCKSWLYLKAMVEMTTTFVFNKRMVTTIRILRVEWNKLFFFILTGLILIEKINSRRSLL